VYSTWLELAMAQQFSLYSSLQILTLDQQVNTASRMESNGVVGRIHVSQATADALTAAGKGSWLTQRPDRIVAKGKGEMITYFVSIRPLTSRSSGSMSGDDDDGDHVKAVDDAAVQQDCRRQDVTSSIFVDV